jgi:hypothetical protein
MSRSSASFSDRQKLNEKAAPGSAEILLGVTNLRQKKVCSRVCPPEGKLGKGPNDPSRQPGYPRATTHLASETSSTEDSNPQNDSVGKDARAIKHDRASVIFFVILRLGL